MALAHHGVGVVDAGGAHAHADLARTRSGIGLFAQEQGAVAAGAFHDDALHDWIKRKL